MISTELRLANIASDSKIRRMGGIYLMRDEEDRFEQKLFKPDARSKATADVVVRPETTKNHEASFRRKFS